MNNFEKIRYSQQLVDKKEKFERKLKNVEEEMLQNQSNCKHEISVGDIFYYVQGKECYGFEYRCLFCGRYLTGLYMAWNNMKVPKFFIDVRDYLANKYDLRDKRQRDEKFATIQTMAMGIFRQNPCMTLEEFTAYFNNMIQEDIAAKKKENNQDDGIVPKRNLTKENFKNKETD